MTKSSGTILDGESRPEGRGAGTAPRNTEPGWVRRLSTQHYIDGSLVTAEGSDVFDVIDPATESRLGQIADATTAEVDRAVAIANVRNPDRRLLHFA